MHCESYMPKLKGGSNLSFVYMWMRLDSAASEVSYGIRWVVHGRETGRGRSG